MYPRGGRNPFTVQFSANYRPFGPAYQSTGSETFMYTDKPCDTATGVYYYGARYHDPSVGLC